MQLDSDDLRNHYASLSDDELLSIDRADLTDLAQRYYSRELERRDLNEESSEDTRQYAMNEAGSPPNWLDDAIPVAVFAEYPGNPASAAAADAVAILQQAGIPCEISVPEADEEDTEPARPEYRVMVPAGLSLLATSVLDKEFFNPRMEMDWKTHLETISDRDLLALDADTICAGLLDRAERLKKTYEDEVARRRLKPR